MPEDQDQDDDVFGLLAWMVCVTVFLATVFIGSQLYRLSGDVDRLADTIESNE